MHWWCHCLGHQREFLSFPFFFFYKAVGINSSFVAQKLKISHYHLSPSPPSFTIWVYIIFNKAPTKLWTTGGKKSRCTSATLCRWKWKASLKPPAAPHAEVSQILALPFQNTSNQIKSGKQGWRFFEPHPVSASFVLIPLPVSALSLRTHPWECEYSACIFKEKGEERG